MARDGAVLGSAWRSAEDAWAEGRALRESLPREAHAAVGAGPDRPTVAAYLAARDRGRLPHLLPIGHGRMVADPFAFFRGSAGLMAGDLAHEPVTGVDAQLCGDAHAANFGLYGTHDGRIVMDLNDFDETVVGPWEWDLKRLATSLVLAARVGEEVPDDVAREAARDAARSYRDTVAHLADLPFVEAWSALGDESAIDQADADELFDDFKKAAKKARRNTSEKVAGKITSREVDGDWHFRPDPPLLTALPQDEEDAVMAGLADYAATLRRSWQQLLARFRPCDVALRVVGTGSVGLRSYVVLLQGNGQEALVLQAKEATPSALAAHLPGGAPVVRHEGKRIVLGARLAQSVSDQLMGWSTIDGRPFVVRQFRNRKGSIDPTLLTTTHLDDYGRLAGALLARAHGRTLDARVLAGYLGAGDDGADFDEAVAAHALACADRTTEDHRAMVALVEDGTLPVVDA